MALNFDQFSATAYKLYRKTLADNVMKKIGLYAFMKKKGNIERKSGGLKIVEPLMYGLNSTFKSYSSYDLLDTTPQDGITAAEFDWKDIACAVTISKQEEDQNKGETRIINLLKSKISQAEKTCTLNFNKMLFGDGTGNGGKDTNGLANLVAAAGTGTIGGIDSSAYTWWQNQTTTITSFATLGRAGMVTAYNEACREGDQPNIIITDQTTFEAYETQLVAIERINFSKGSELAGDLGFETQTFKGKPMIWDYYATAGKIYMLNTDYLKLVVDSDTDFTMTEWRVPTNQMVKTAHILFRGNLVINNRQVQSNITVSSYT